MYDNVMSVLQNRWVQSVAVLLVLVVAAYLVYLISPLVTPVLLALLVAYLLDPVVDFLERKGARRSISATGLAVLGLAILAAIPLIIIPQIIEEAEDLISSAEQGITEELTSEGDDSDEASLLDRFLEWFPMSEFVRLMGWDEKPLPFVPGVAPSAEAPPGGDVEATPEAVADAPVPEASAEAEADTEEAEVAAVEPVVVLEDDELTEREAWAIFAVHVGSYVRDNMALIAQRYAGQVATAIQAGGVTVGNLLGRIWSFVVSFLAFLVNFSIFAFATGYLLVSFDTLVKRARELVPIRYREDTYRIAGQIDRQLRGFVNGQLVVALCEAIIYSIGLTIAGVPFGFVIGLMTGFLSFIPYLGVMMGLIPSLILVTVRYGFGDSGDPGAVPGYWHILGVLLTFGLVQTVEEVFLRPVVLGDKVGLHPVWVMSAFLVFGHAFGFVGILAAVPLAAVLKVLVVEAHSRYHKSKLFQAKKPT